MRLNSKRTEELYGAFALAFCTAMVIRNFFKKKKKKT